MATNVFAVKPINDMNWFKTHPSCPPEKKHYKVRHLSSIFMAVQTFGPLYVQINGDYSWLRTGLSTLTLGQVETNIISIYFAGGKG